LPALIAGRIFNFLSKRLQPPAARLSQMRRSQDDQTNQRVRHAARLSEPSAAAPASEEGPMPDMDDPRVARVMSEMERDMEHMDENNPRHMAHMMKKMKDLMPSGAVPKEFDIAIKRLESGEDPEKIEADMGDVLGGLMGGEEGAGPGGMGGGGGYTHDSGLYDY
jgi:hypothetical protein